MVREYKSLGMMCKLLSPEGYRFPCLRMEAERRRSPLPEIEAALAEALQFHLELAHGISKQG